MPVHITQWDLNNLITLSGFYYKTVSLGIEKLLSELVFEGRDTNKNNLISNFFSAKTNKKKGSRCRREAGLPF